MRRLYSHKLHKASDFVVIVNPHLGSFGRSVHDFYKGNRVPDRYLYLLKELANEQKLRIYINPTETSFKNEFAKRSTRIFKLGKLEFRIWRLIHGLKFGRDVIVKQVRDERVFLFFSDLSRSTLRFLQKIEGIKYIHLSHYFRNIEQRSMELSSVKNIEFISEGELKTSLIYKTFFSNRIPTHILPFATHVNGRVENGRRINKCAAVGSLLEVKLMRKFTNSNYLHPMRAVIYENRDRLTDEIDCFISSPHSKDGNQKVGGYYNSFSPQLIYSSYSMFIAPEELTGLPSYNFVEGMAAGCVLLAPELGCYREIGMTPFLHYIPYGAENIESLISTIQQYRYESGLLEKIRAASFTFALDHFEFSRVYDQFKGIVFKD